jgi:hypothetical protein
MATSEKKVSDKRLVFFRGSFCFPPTVVVNVKSDSPIAYRAHATPMLVPCHAVPLRV